MSEGNGGGVTLSYGLLRIVGSIVGIVGVLVAGVYSIGDKVAKASDVAELRIVVKGHTDDIHKIELDMARYFGRAEPQARPTSLKLISFTVPYTNQQKQLRSVVVTREFVEYYRLNAGGEGYQVLGADGRLYTVDEVLAALVRERSDQIRLEEFRKQRK